MDLERRYELSSPFFVEYYDENGRTVGLPEKVQPLSGQKLRECLDYRLRQRGLVPSSVQFFVENSKTPLPDNCEVNFLSGQRVITRVQRAMTRFGRNRTCQSFENDSNESKTPSRKSSDEINAQSWKSSLVNSKMTSRIRGSNLPLSHSGSSCQEYESRSRKHSTTSQPSTFLSIPLDEPSCSEDLQAISAFEESGTRRTRSAAATRISLFFGKEKAEMISRLNVIKDEMHNAVSMLELEDHWSVIVRSEKVLSKRAYEQQEAIWEFVTTEHRYLQLLKQMNELCQCFLKIQDCGFMRDIDPRRVFLNYPELYVHNSKFWKRAILPMLQATREFGLPLDATTLRSGFERIDEWWPCYTTFIYGHSDCHAYVQKCQKENELFREFVTWAESLDTMRRQRLLDALTNPMQRLTRYSLLLKAVLKHSIVDEEKDAIQEMIIRIEKATRNVEETLNSNDLQNKLNELSRTIESYEAVDAEEFERIFPMKCSIRLSDPMPYFHGQPQFRRVYLRGDLKLKDGRQGAKIDAHCILFTDLFLVCKQMNKRYDRLRILKPPIHIAKMCLQQFSDYSGFVISPINDFGLPSALYFLSAPSIEDTRKWLEMTNMALRDFYQLKPVSPQHCVVGIPAGLQNGFPTVDSTSCERGRSLNSVTFGYQEAVSGVVPDIVHRKSSSMDSQWMAEHYRIAKMRKVNTVQSADQIDRLYRDSRMINDSSSEGNLAQRHKLTVCGIGAGDIADQSSLVNCSVIGQSKSSLDLHVSPKSIYLDSPSTSRRSRSNSTGLTGTDSRSRSGSPQTRASKIVLWNSSDTASVSLERNDSSEKNAEPGVTPNALNGKVEHSDSPTISNHDISMINADMEKRSMSPSVDPDSDDIELALRVNAALNNNARRFERRYHTSDGIDVLKPKVPANIPPGILKRFSWNVSTAVGGSSRKISNRMNEQNSRRQSQSTVASSESFSSSTSGFSTASSYLDGSTVTEELTPAGDSDVHVSTVSIDDKIEEVIEDTRTLEINISDDESNGRNMEVCKKSPPPLPEVPPPMLIVNEKDISENINPPKHQELLKFIMDNHLETSDV